MVSSVRITQIDFKTWLGAGTGNKYLGRSEAHVREATWGMGVFEQLSGLQVALMLL